MSRSGLTGSIRATKGSLLATLAEREGFEPSVPLRIHMISNHAPSATRSSLHVAVGNLDAGDSGVAAFLRAISTRAQGRARKMLLICARRSVWLHQV